MAEQGIITGIGDSLNDINVITPEIDAKLNNYILGKSGFILEGLEVPNNTTLTAGTCVLCGYRGILENDVTISPPSSNNKYIYGEFTINFGNYNLLDRFRIIESNTNYTEPTSITEQGVYYLKLYAWLGGSSWADVHSGYNSKKYPYKAQNANQANTLVSGGTIASTATATTQTVNDNSTKVATTAYVHNQIAQEIDYDTQTIAINTVDIMGGSGQSGTIELKRKAKYVVGKVTISANTTLYNVTSYSATLPNGFIPKQDGYFLVQTNATQPTFYNSNARFLLFTLTANSNSITITINDKKWESSQLPIGKTTTIIGYETN